MDDNMVETADAKPVIHDPEHGITHLEDIPATAVTTKSDQAKGGLSADGTSLDPEQAANFFKNGTLNLREGSDGESGIITRLTSLWRKFMPSFHQPPTDGKVKDGQLINSSQPSHP